MSEGESKGVGRGKGVRDRRGIETEWEEVARPNRGGLYTSQKVLHKGNESLNV